MSEKRFRVIVIGGGPAGLTAAHALSQAGIDYIVLERRHSVVADVGASLALYPQGLRVLAQLGLWRRLRPIGAEVKRCTTFTLDGYKYRESSAPSTFKKNHGTAPVVFHRADLLQALFDGLGDDDKACILTSKKVINILANTDGVQVFCEDGTHYTGSMLIGADGVHSVVRQRMRQLALTLGTPESQINEEKPFLAEYRALWCNFPRPAGLDSGDYVESHGKGLSVQCLNGKDRSWMFIYERLDQPTSDKVRYTADETAALAYRARYLAVSEGLRVKDVLRDAYMYTSGMANLEEGVVEHWSWGRIVLVGDACHKMTPNHGLGYNNGIQDVVALVNELHAMLFSSPPSSSGLLEIEHLMGAFSRYKAARMELLQKDYDASRFLTRASAWHNWAFRVADRYIFPRIPGLDNFLLTHVVAKGISKTLVLDFVEGEETFEGRVPWKKQIKARSLKLLTPYSTYG
ncbi:hypothetical protein OQA88_7009 [Cercophora sp. LCS_1]